MNDAAVLAHVWRGDVLECVIRGHVAVVRADGTLVQSAGDPSALTTMRSVVKPLQAQPFVLHAADALGCSVDEVAIACGSHDGEDRHVETVRALLARAGIDESLLSCGAQEPYNRAAAHSLIASGANFLPVHNNCSGKHAAMLATCKVMNWPLAEYAHYDHPAQVAVRESFRDIADCDLNSAAVGIDGCGLPTYGITIADLARMFAIANRVTSFQRCQDAMAAEPFLVGGSRRFDSELLTAIGDQVTGKSGGAAVWAGVHRAGGPGLALKLEAGAGEYLAPVVVALLQQLDLLPAEVPEGLARFVRPSLRNVARDEVGVTRSTLRLTRH